MKLLAYLLFIMTITSCSTTSQDTQNSTNKTSKSHIEIVQPTVEQEASSVWRTIKDIAFFEKQGYTIHLPKNPVIDSLIAKSKNDAFGNDDFPTIYTLLETKVFDSTNYEQAIQQVESQFELVNKMINEIDAEKDEWDWEFKRFEQYKVVLTLYGTGGSYDPDKGIITLWTNKAGDFKQYKNPVNTIIHEITHMGMEYSLVRKYKLSHAFKERLVDAFVQLMFQKQLPDYRIQEMGNVKVGEHVRTQADIRRLNAIILRIAEE